MLMFAPGFSDDKRNIYWRLVLFEFRLKRLLNTFEGGEIFTGVCLEAA